MPRKRRWPGIFFRALLAFVLIALAVTFFSTDHFKAFGGAPDEATLARMRLSNQFKGHKFKNDEPDFIPDRKLFFDTLHDYAFGKEMRAPSCALPLFPNTAELVKAAPGTGLRITWLGHSTALIQLDGAAILTDPVWSERASPFTWIGPKRFHPPPLALEALPKIDAVVISHDHYDHLDMNTVRALAARGVPFHVPLGIGAHLAKWGVPAGQIFEHDWWESAHIPGISGDINVISTPSRHFSGRGLLWRTGTHWTSWVIQGPSHRVFFSGDTGYTEHFREIANRFGPFDVAMIEIGQWHPSWGDIHLGPKGALDAFALLDAKLFFPIHWATFELALHDWSEPAETLTVEAQKRGVPITTPMLGQPVEPAVNAPDEAWWRKLPPTAASCPD